MEYLSPHTGAIAPLGPNTGATLKFASYLRFDKTPTMGVLVKTVDGDRLLDLHLAERAFNSDGKGSHVLTGLGADLFELVQRGDAALKIAGELVGWAENRLNAAPRSLDDMLVDPASVHFLAPIGRPGKIIAIGANYPSHVEEIGDKNLDPAIAAMGKNLSSGEYPPAFAKLASSLVGHGQTIPYPKFTKQLDYEAELAVVIGRDCQNFTEERALDNIAGFIIANDLSARDVQFKEMKRGLLLLGKNFECSGPMGPYFVTRDEVADIEAIQIRCWVNGELRQSDMVSRMIYSIPKALAYYSQMPLQAGDIFLTGSPAGVAIGREHPENFLLRPGDVIEIEMSGLGRLMNTVVEARN